MPYHLLEPEGTAQKVQSPSVIPNWILASSLSIATYSFSKIYIIL